MKIKIGLFFGGKSVEHEISVISALQAAESLDKGKYDLVPVYITKEGDMYSGPAVGDIENYKDIKKLISDSQRVHLINVGSRVELIKLPVKKLSNNYFDYIDIAFPVVHGTNVEDGTLQGFFKTLGLPFVGCDVTSSAAGMDKLVTKSLLKNSGIPVLDCVCLNRWENMALDEKTIVELEEKIMYPMIVKPVNLGSSVGIKKAANREELIEAVELAFQFATTALVEHAVEDLMEINCSVLGDTEDAVPSECEEPVSSDEILSYEDKYLGGESSKGMSGLKRRLPADIPQEMKEKIQKLAVDSFKALNCNGVVRIDFLIDRKTEEVWVNEVNTIPGSLSFYLWGATGVSYPELLDRIISLALKRERENKELLYSFDTNVLAEGSFKKAKGSKSSKL